MKNHHGKLVFPLLKYENPVSSRRGQISYNTTVILYNFEAMRRDNWNKMSQEAYQASTQATVTAHTVINQMIEEIIISIACRKIPNDYFFYNDYLTDLGYV